MIFYDKPWWTMTLQTWLLLNKLFVSQYIKVISKYNISLKANL